MSDRSVTQIRGEGEERQGEQKPEGSLPPHRKEVKVSEVKAITDSFSGNSCYSSVPHFLS